MRNLLQLIQRYHFFLLFLLLEVVSVIFVVNNNQQKKQVIISSANAVSGYFYEKFNFISEYFSLREKNRKLAIENARYRNSFIKSYKSNIVIRKEIEDSVYQQQYMYITAKVVNNSVSKQYNYLTLDKGYLDGVKLDMGVISSEGVIGVVRDVSKHYASVISILNRKIGISAKIKKNNYFGSVVWNGDNYQKAILKEIPNHVNVEIGDTIITSGFSAIFPEGIPIGIVAKIDQEPGDNFYKITIDLTANLKNITHVYIVADLFKEERKELENIVEDD